MPPPPPQLTGALRLLELKPSGCFHEMFKKFAGSTLVLPSGFLLLIVLVSCVRCVVFYNTRRKRRRETRTSQGAREKHPTPVTSAAPMPNTSTYKPVYPWTSPPQPLPGPYDPRLYPLPTIRRHSYHEPSTAVPAETNTISYTRRVSTNSMPPRQTVLHGTVTTTTTKGSPGWRRNQWVVGAG